MPQEKHLNVPRKQQYEKKSFNDLDFTLCRRKNHDQILETEHGQPNFGTKRSYSDKQNQIINYASSSFQDQRKFLKKPFTATENHKQQKNKKYAYIKNSNALIHSQKYEFSINDSHDYSENNNYQITQTKEPHNSKLQSAQKPHDNRIFSNKKSQNISFVSKDQEIQFLRQSLKQERHKFQQFQQQTIQNQINILDTITNLQDKLKQLKAQNLLLIQQNSSLKTQIQNNNPNSVPKSKTQNLCYEKASYGTQFDEIKQLNQEIEKIRKRLDKKETELFDLEQSYKKIKGVAKGLGDMMRKVDNIYTPEGQDETKYAWKWIKKVVWEYEAIRKKAYEWKKAYDQLNKDSENELSVSSEDAY